MQLKGIELQYVIKFLYLKQSNGCKKGTVSRIWQMKALHKEQTLFTFNDINVRDN